jgi:hypothetical protein
MLACDTMGKPEINIAYEEVKRVADANRMTVPATLAMIATAAAKDQKDHPIENGTQLSSDLGRLDDDGSPTVKPVNALV